MGLRTVNGEDEMLSVSDPFVGRNNKSRLLSREWAREKRLRYVLSPISQQIMATIDNDNEPLATDFGQLMERFAPGYRSQQSKSAVDKFFEVGRDNDNKQRGARTGEEEMCRTMRSPLELNRDEVEPASGQLLRTCRGLVSVNRCEGACKSTVEPSVRARSGFKQVSSGVCLKERRCLLQHNTIIDPLSPPPHNISAGLRLLQRGLI